MTVSTSDEAMALPVVVGQCVPVFHHPCGTREVRWPWAKPHDCEICRAISENQSNA